MTKSRLHIALLTASSISSRAKVSADEQKHSHFWLDLSSMQNPLLSAVEKQT